MNESAGVGVGVLRGIEESLKRTFVFSRVSGFVGCELLAFGVWFLV